MYHESQEYTLLRRMPVCLCCGKGYNGQGDKH